MPHIKQDKVFHICVLVAAGALGGLAITSYRTFQVLETSLEKNRVLLDEIDEALKSLNEFLDASLENVKREKSRTI